MIFVKCRNSYTSVISIIMEDFCVCYTIFSLMSACVITV